MKHFAADFNNSIWILQALATLTITVFVFHRLSFLELNYGFIRTMVSLIILESVFTLVFDSMIMLQVSSKLAIAVYSIAIGGEVCVKGLALCLFAFKYYSSSFEVPSYIRLSNGEIQIKLANTENTVKFRTRLEVAKAVYMLILVANWVLVSLS